MKERKAEGRAVLTAPGKFENFATYLVAILCILMSGFLFLNSMLHTTAIRIVKEESGIIDTVVESVKMSWESVVYNNDNFITNLLWTALLLVAVFFVVPKMKKLPLWAEIAGVCGLTFIVSLIWIFSSQTAPTEDSIIVTSAADAFAKGDYTFLTGEDRYFRNYSFQLGYVFFNEILFRIVNLFGGVKTYLFLQVANAVFLCVIYGLLIAMSEKVFGDKRVRHLTAILLLFSLQPVISNVFVYGMIPGLMFAVLALYFEILWLKKGNITYMFLSAIAIGLAVMIKSNYLIALIALCAAALVKGVSRFKSDKKKAGECLIFIVLACVLSLTVQGCIKTMYEKRSGTDLGDAVPYSAWIYMGLSEAENAPGWYNIYKSVYLYEAADFDPKVTNKEAISEIKDRLAYFAEHKQYASNFFYRKIVSQWNETSYESIWNNQIRGQYKEKTGIAKWVCDKGQADTEKLMDIWTQLVFLGFFAGCVVLFKKKDFLALMLPLMILGGFMYHCMSEAKSQYSLVYYILMAGFAGYGIIKLYDLLAAKAGEKDNRFFKVLLGVNGAGAVPVPETEEEEKKEEEKEKNKKKRERAVSLADYVKAKREEKAETEIAAETADKTEETENTAENSKES